MECEKRARSSFISARTISTLEFSFAASFEPSLLLNLTKMTKDEAWVHLINSHIVEHTKVATQIQPSFQTFKVTH